MRTRSRRCGAVGFPSDTCRTPAGQSRCAGPPLSEHGGAVGDVSLVRSRCASFAWLPLPGRERKRSALAPVEKGGGGVHLPGGGGVHFALPPLIVRRKPDATSALQATRELAAAPHALHVAVASME